MKNNVSAETMAGMTKRAISFAPIILAKVSSALDFIQIAQLEEQYKLTNREVRAVVSYYALNEVPIYTTSEGVKIARTAAEMQSYIARLRATRDALTERIEAAERAQHVVGQPLSESQMSMFNEGESHEQTGTATRS